VIARIVALGIALVVCLSSAPGAAQQLPLAPRFSIQAPTEDPQKLQLPLRAPLTLVPTITLSEESNDTNLIAPQGASVGGRNRAWGNTLGRGSRLSAR
jgi:hypothetical protein